MRVAGQDPAPGKIGVFPLKYFSLTIGVALLVGVLSVHWGGVTGTGRLLAVFAATAAFILVLAARAASPSRPPAGGRLLLIPIALIVGAVLVAGFSPFPALGRLEWREIVSAALLLAAFLLLRPPDSARLLFYLAALSLGAALVVYGFIRREGMIFPGVPLTATYLNRNHFAAFLGLIFPASLAFSLVSRPRAVSWLSRAGLPVLLAGIVLTRSRGALLAAFPAGIGVLSLFILGRSRGKKAIVILIIGSLLAAAAGAVLLPRAPGPELYSTSLDALSIRTRISNWKSTLDMFLARPLLGWGWGTFRHIYPGYKEPGVWYVVPHANNEYLQLLAEGGAVGFLIIISCLVFSLLRLVKIYLSAPRAVSGIFALGAAGALIYAAVHSGFDFILRLPANTLSLASLVGLGLSAGLDQRKSSGLTGRRPVPRLVGLTIAGALIIFLFLPLFRFYRSEMTARQGERLLAAGDPEAAGELFSRAHRLDPDSPRPLLGRAAAGMAVFDRAEDQAALYNSILADLETARRINPRDIRPLRRLSRFHRRLSAYEQAEADLEEALALDPVNPFLYYELAENDLSRGASLSAARRLRRATEIYPMIWGDARDLLFRHTGDYEILKELPPRQAQFHRRMGYQLLPADNPAGAEREFIKALELAPKDPENLRGLARLYARIGRLEEARRYYQEALARAPDNHQWLAELGDVYQDLDLTAEALACYLQARDLDPASRRYPEKAGAAILALRGPEEALSFWEEASAGDPGWARPHFVRATLLLAAGRTAEAQREIDRAVFLHPGNRDYAKWQVRIENIHRREESP